jgi:RimJ/RimL family protein N-acetyltransferase
MIAAHFEPWHLMSVVLHCRDEDKEDREYFAIEEDLQKWACRKVLQPGLIFTVLSKTGEPVSCFGFTEDSPTVATAWVIGRPDWKVHVKTIAKGTHHVLKHGDYIRLQAWIRPDRPPAIKFAEWLGFKRDGCCPMIAPNRKDMLLYSLTREGEK